MSKIMGGWAMVNQLGPTGGRVKEMLTVGLRP